MYLLPTWLVSGPPAAAACNSGSCFSIWASLSTLHICKGEKYKTSIFERYYHFSVWDNCRNSSMRNPKALLLATNGIGRCCHIQSNDFVFKIFVQSNTSLQFKS